MKVDKKALFPSVLVFVVVLVAGGTYFYMWRTNDLKLSKASAKLDKVLLGEGGVSGVQAGFVPSRQVQKTSRGKVRTEERRGFRPTYAGDPFDGPIGGSRDDATRMEAVLLKLNKQVQVLEVLGRMADLWQKIHTSGLLVDPALLSAVGLRSSVSRARSSFSLSPRSSAGGLASLLKGLPTPRRVETEKKPVTVVKKPVRKTIRVVNAKENARTASLPKVLGAFQGKSKPYLVVEIGDGEVAFVSVGESIDGYRPVSVKLGNGEVRVIWRKGKAKRGIVKTYAF